MVSTGTKRTVGNKDQAVHQHLKCYIGQGDILVCGVIGDGTSKEIQCNWDSPFEGEDVGSRFRTTAGLAQIATDRTSITTINTRQIWNGNRPTQFNLNLILYALSDPKSEVMDALQALEEFASPQLMGTIPVSFSLETWRTDGFSSALNTGRIPNLVSINIGRRAMYPECVLESISQPLDKEIDRNGNLIRAEVQLQISTVVVPNRDEVTKFYNG